MLNSARRAGSVAAVLLAAAFFLQACGSSGSDDGASTSSPGAPQPPPEPTITGNTFVFPGRGYAVKIPEGWTADANSVTVGPLKVDSFLSSEEIDGVQTNITVSCQELSTAVTTAEYVESRLETARQLDARDLRRLGSLDVGGYQAEMVEYAFVRDQVTIQRVDVMFVGGPCAWTVSLSAAPSAVDAARTVLDQFLQSFEVLASEE